MSNRFFESPGAPPAKGFRQLMSLRCDEETPLTYLPILSVAFDLDCYLQASVLSNEACPLLAARLGSQLLQVVPFLARLECFHDCFHKSQLIAGVFRQMEAKLSPEKSSPPLVVR